MGIALASCSDETEKEIAEQQLPALTQQQVMQQVLKLQEQSSNWTPDQELGTDNYRISLVYNRFSFSNSASFNYYPVRLFRTSYFIYKTL